MAIMKTTIPAMSDHFKRSTSCCCCTELADPSMVVEQTPSRGTGKVGYFHRGCWEKVWTELELAMLNPTWGEQTSDGLEYIQLLYPERFNAKLHASMIDKAYTKTHGQRKAQWFFMGDCYRSPKFQSGRAHAHLKNVEKYCPAGKLVVLVFFEGKLVDRDELAWGVKDAEGRFCKPSEAKNAKGRICKPSEVYFEGCNMVNELANRNRIAQISCEAREKQDKVKAAKVRK